MHSSPALRLPAEYRLARIQKWLTLWLVWFTAHVLAIVAPDAARGWLTHMRRQTLLLLLAHALKRVRLPAQGGRTRCYDPHAARHAFSLRAMIGADINRALRGRGPRDQACVLYDALTNPEPLIARLARRLARGFTRRRRMRHPALRAPALRLRAPPPRAVDSS